MNGSSAWRERHWAFDLAGYATDSTIATMDQMNMTAVNRTKLKEFYHT